MLVKKRQLPTHVAVAVGVVVAAHVLGHAAPVQAAVAQAAVAQAAVAQAVRVLAVVIAKLILTGLTS